MKLIAVGGRKLDMPYIENWARELDRSIGGDEDHTRRRALIVPQEGCVPNGF
jgi:hypothetical protein